jgi:hypothetical protein
MWKVRCTSVAVAAAVIRQPTSLRRLNRAVEPDLPECTRFDIRMRRLSDGGNNAAYTCARP